MASTRPVAANCGTPLLRRRRIGLLDLLGLGRQRARLAQLDRTMLEDIGVTEAEAREEARRAPWDVPAHWRR